MTITSVRIYFHALSEARTRQLGSSYWGFAEWFPRRLKPIREQLRGPEVEGVDIMNLMPYENGHHASKPNQWYQRGNTFEYAFVCDLRPLENGLSIDNIPKLMRFYAEVAAAAPWPQARVIATALQEPLSAVDRITLLPFLQWPRGEKLSDSQAKRLLANAI